MADQFTILSIKPTRGGYGQETDLTALRVVNAKYWSFQPTAEDQDKPSSFRVRHRADLTPALDLSEGYRWAAGWRNRASGVWNASREVYGGYVQTLSNTGQGRLKALVHNCTGFNGLFRRTRVRSWPDPNDFFALYPLERSARDWLIGSTADGAPYDGVLRQVLAGYDIDWTGVDPEFESVIFGLAPDGLLYVPGKSVSESPARGRSYRYLMLNEVMDDMLEAIRLRAPAMDPVAWFEPVVSPFNPTEIIPRFRLRDRNNESGAPEAVYAIDPLPGEWQIENPAVHERDWTEVAANIEVKSAGFELVGGVAMLKTANGYDADKAARYQTTWQTEDGWQDLIVDETIPTRAECQVLADTQVNYRWGAQGRITIRSSHYSRQGAMILLNWPQEGQNYARHRVTDVNLVPNIGRPLYDIQCGARRPDTANIFQRQARRLTRLWTLNHAKTGSGAPQARPISTNPLHPGQNVGQASNDTTPWLTVQAGYVAPGDTRTSTPVNRVQYLAPDGSVGSSISDADGRPHPNALHAGTFVTDASFKLTFPVYQIQVTAIDLEGTGSVVLLKDSVPVSGTLTGPGRFPISPPIPYNPRSGGTPAEWIVITTSGTSSGDPLGVVIWEA
jgi:hypothetical protein